MYEHERPNSVNWPMRCNLSTRPSTPRSAPSPLFASHFPSKPWRECANQSILYRFTWLSVRFGCPLRLCIEVCDMHRGQLCPGRSFFLFIKAQCQEKYLCSQSKATGVNLAIARTCYEIRRHAVQPMAWRGLNLLTAVFPASRAPRACREVTIPRYFMYHYFLLVCPYHVIVVAIILNA